MRIRQVLDNIENSSFRNLNEFRSSFNDNMREYLKGHCYHPVTLSVHDNILGVQKMIKVRCNNCYNCRLTRKNEWVTRCYAHSESFPYVYFCTLTFRGFKPSAVNKISASSFLIKYLSDLCYVVDDRNETNNLVFSPSIINKRHYQLFIKRLRKRVSSPISYVVSGEYGHNYGRPHYHLIVFSKSPISVNDFNLAWSLKIKYDFDSKQYVFARGREGTYVSFGRIQVDDLVSNGSFSAKNIVVDGKTLDAHRCFAYVCKYILKNDYNDSRVKSFYNSLKDNTFFGHYDFNLSEKFLSLYKSFDYETFKSEFKPFFEVSRSPSVGKLYFDAHIDQFSKGLFPKPVLQTKGFVQASYFVRQIKRLRFPFREQKISYVNGSRYQVIPSCSSFIDSVFSLPKSSFLFRNCVDIDLVNSNDEVFLNKLLRSNRVFRDLRDNSYCLFSFDKSDPLTNGSMFNFYVDKYLFDRSSCSFVLKEIVTLDSFFKEFYNYYVQYYYILLDKYSLLDKEFKDYNLFVDYVNQFIDFDSIYGNLVDAIESDISYFYKSYFVKRKSNLID